MRFLSDLYHEIVNWRWEIGFIDNTLDEVVNGGNLKVHWVKLPFRDRWFADPFILDYSDKSVTLLCEEFSDELKKGRIAKIVVDRTRYELKSWKIIFELPTHLSFPRIVRNNENVYVHPENSANGNHTLYRYDEERECLVDGKVICDSPLTDAVMLEDGEKHLIFSTYEPNPNGDVLTVFEKVGELYKKKEEIEFGNNYARMAGDFFTVGNKLYRPAQDCNGDYGKAIIIQEVVSGNGRHWGFKNVRRMKSSHPILRWGMHTFNHYKDVIVIDVKGPRYPIIGDFLWSLSCVVKKLFRRM